MSLWPTNLQLKPPTNTIINRIKYKRFLITSSRSLMNDNYDIGSRWIKDRFWTHITYIDSSGENKIKVRLIGSKFNSITGVQVTSFRGFPTKK